MPGISAYQAALRLLSQSVTKPPSSVPAPDETPPMMPNSTPTSASPRPKVRMK